MMFGENLFDMLGGMGHRVRRTRHKGEDTIQELPVNLEDLYRGKVSKLQLTKKVICVMCKGIGGESGAVQKCSSCRGSGRVIITRQMGPMIQQMQTRCDTCSGEGDIIDPSLKCTHCNGRRTTQEKKIIEVHIEPGMRDGEKILLEREGDQEPGIEPGDVILVLKTKEHKIFKRVGDDLWMKRHVSLKEALCGCMFVINHLDNRKIVLQNSYKKVIKPESIFGVVGEGMVNKRTGARGNLYVCFIIDFPENYFLPNERFADLRHLLPQPPKEILSLRNAEDVSLSDFDEEKYQRSHGRSEAYSNDDDEEDHHPHAQNVQCATQ